MALRALQLGLGIRGLAQDRAEVSEYQGVRQLRGPKREFGHFTGDFRGFARSLGTGKADFAIRFGHFPNNCKAPESDFQGGQKSSIAPAVR